MNERFFQRRVMQTHLVSALAGTFLQLYKHNRILNYITWVNKWLLKFQALNIFFTT